MPLEITYWTERPDDISVAGQMISSEPSRTLSGTSALTSGSTPDNAVWVSAYSTEAARIAYGSIVGASPTASSSSAYIGAGERLWLTAAAGHKVAGITA